MADFDELLESLQNPGEAGIPDSIYDDLRLSRDDLVASHVQAQDGATTKIQELESHISKLKTQNYDLMMNSSKPEADGSGDSDPDGDDSDSDNDDDDKDIDSLFGK